MVVISNFWMFLVVVGDSELLCRASDAFPCERNDPSGSPVCHLLYCVHLGLDVEDTPFMHNVDSSDEPLPAPNKQTPRSLSFMAKNDETNPFWWCLLGEVRRQLARLHRKWATPTLVKERLCWWNSKIKTDWSLVNWWLYNGFDRWLMDGELPDALWLYNWWLTLCSLVVTNSLRRSRSEKHQLVQNLKYTTHFQCFTQVSWIIKEMVHAKFSTGLLFPSTKATVRLWT